MIQDGMHYITSTPSGDGAQNQGVKHLATSFSTSLELLMLKARAHVFLTTGTNRRTNPYEMLQNNSQRMTKFSVPGSSTIQALPVWFNLTVRMGTSPKAQAPTHRSGEGLAPRHQHPLNPNPLCSPSAHPPQPGAAAGGTAHV